MSWELWPPQPLKIRPAWSQMRPLGLAPGLACLSWLARASWILSEETLTPSLYPLSQPPHPRVRSGSGSRAPETLSRHTLTAICVNTPKRPAGKEQCTATAYLALPLAGVRGLVWEEAGVLQEKACGQPQRGAGGECPEAPCTWPLMRSSSFCPPPWPGPRHCQGCSSH